MDFIHNNLWYAITLPSNGMKKCITLVITAARLSIVFIQEIDNTIDTIDMSQLSIIDKLSIGNTFSIYFMPKSWEELLPIFHTFPSVVSCQQCCYQNTYSVWNTTQAVKIIFALVSGTWAAGENQNKMLFLKCLNCKVPFCLLEKRIKNIVLENLTNPFDQVHWTVFSSNNLSCF